MPQINVFKKCGGGGGGWPFALRLQSDVCELELQLVVAAQHGCWEWNLSTLEWYYPIVTLDLLSSPFLLLFVSKSH